MVTVQNGMIVVLLYLVATNVTNLGDMEMHIAHSWLHTNSSMEKVTMKENLQCLPPQTFVHTWALWQILSH